MYASLILPEQFYLLVNFLVVWMKAQSPQKQMSGTFRWISILHFALGCQNPKGWKKRLIQLFFVSSENKSIPICFCTKQVRITSYNAFKSSAVPTWLVRVYRKHWGKHFAYLVFSSLVGVKEWHVIVDDSTLYLIHIRRSNLPIFCRKQHGTTTAAHHPVGQSPVSKAPN